MTRTVTYGSLLFKPPDATGIKSILISSGPTIAELGLDKNRLARVPTPDLFLRHPIAGRDRALTGIAYPGHDGRGRGNFPADVTADRPLLDADGGGERNLRNACKFQIGPKAHGY